METATTHVAKLQSLEIFGPEFSMDNPAQMSKAMAHQLERAKRADKIANDLVARQPGLGFITAMIMAGDMVQAEDITAAVKAGKMTASKGAGMIGSFARFQWAVENLSRPELIRRLLPLWQGSDPDDTNLSYLDLFREKAARSRNRIANDGIPLSSRKTEFLVYRGQQPTEPIGFSWTLDKETAVKFANGAGVRRPTPGGVIYNLEVNRECVLAYITGRGEREVIVDIERAGLMGLAGGTKQ